MKTKKPITMQILGTGQPEFTIPAGTECTPASNLPQGGYWAKPWRKMPRHARIIAESIGIHVTEEEMNQTA